MEQVGKKLARMEYGTGWDEVGNGSGKVRMEYGTGRDEVGNGSG